MSMYAISLQPLISLPHNRSTAKQCWFADAATGAGPLEKKKTSGCLQCQLLVLTRYGIWEIIN